VHFRDPFNVSYLVPTNHRALMDIMINHSYDFEKPWRIRAFLARIIGFGLILSEGASHKMQRKVLNPAFNMNHIRALYGLMWDKTGVMLREIEAEMRANPVEDDGSKGLCGKVEMGKWTR
jgi:cytochrome P450